MAEFLPAFEAAMQHEVSPDFTLGRAHLYADRGFFKDEQTGEVSKWGMTLRTLRSMKYPGLTGDFKRDCALVRRLRPDQISRIYEDWFWRHFSVNGKPALAQVSSQIVSSKAFDVMVHRGFTGGAQTLQRAVRYWFKEIVVDGIIGIDTVRCVNRIPAVTLVPQICLVYRRDLTSIIEDRPVNEKFRDGWMRRSIWPYTAETWAKLAPPVPLEGTIAGASRIRGNVSD